MINNKNLKPEESILRKISFINTHNQINELTIANQKKDEKIKNISSKSKKIIKSYMDSAQDLNNRIKQLEKQNSNLAQEKDYYKNIVDSIPPFVLKIFGKNNKS